MQLNKSLVSLAKDYNGFVVRQTNAYTVLRIPVGRGDLAQQQLDKLAPVKNKEIIGEYVIERHQNIKLSQET